MSIIVITLQIYEFRGKFKEIISTKGLSARNNDLRFFTRKHFVNTCLFPAKLIDNQFWVQIPNGPKRCMQKKWPADMHTVCIGMVTICIEDLAGMLGSQS